MNQDDYLYMTRLQGQEMIANFMGRLRSQASATAYHNPEIDEEAFFVAVRDAWLSGMVNELTRTFGVEKAAELLDPFKRNGTTARIG